MKKAVSIGMAAFYLLLTTGMFVCILHCAADLFAAKPAMVMSNTHSVKMNCTKSNCNCCKKHGEYVVKENLKPTPVVLFTPAAVMVEHAVSKSLFTPKSCLNSYAWADVKAPPGISGKAKSIQFHSLQI